LPSNTPTYTPTNTPTDTPTATPTGPVGGVTEVPTNTPTATPTHGGPVGGVTEEPSETPTPSARELPNTGAGDATTGGWASLWIAIIAATAVGMVGIGARRGKRQSALKRR
jgi:hypothetical protein